MAARIALKTEGDQAVVEKDLELKTAVIGRIGKKYLSPVIHHTDAINLVFVDTLDLAEKALADVKEVQVGQDQLIFVRQAAAA